MLHGAGRSLGAAALTAGLAISRPCAAADSDAPRRIRTGAEILAFLALDFGQPVRFVRPYLRRSQRRRGASLFQRARNLSGRPRL